MTAIYARSLRPHFAPSVETVRFAWTPAPQHKVVTAKIEIKDRAGTVVLRKTLSAGSRQRFDWDGEDTEAGPVNGPAGPIPRYVNPLRSPFTATITAKVCPAGRMVPPPTLSTAANPALERCKPDEPPPVPPRPVEVTATARVAVLYREVRLRRMTWREAYEAISGQVGTAFPAGAGNDVQQLWLQYRLNELGYPAGPLDRVAPTAPIVRAAFRYALAHPDLPKVRSFGTLSPWSWEDAWETEYGDIDDILAGTKPSGLALRDALARGDNPRVDVVETPEALTKRDTDSRLVLDHDIYYINKDFSEPDAHADYDAQFLNPITLPLCAEVLLVSGTDADATHGGVHAPAAVGPVALEWVVFDPPEDLSVVPTPIAADVPLRSQARRYLRQVHEDVARSLDDPRDSQDNCPRTHGGASPSSYGDMRGYLEPLPDVATSRSPNGRRFISIGCSDPSHALDGRSPVFFTGSYVAGDNWVIQARLTFDGVADGDALKADHLRLAGLARSFAPIQRWMPSDAHDPTVAQTGVLTLWRRHHVACELHWGPCDMPPIEWFPIIDNFRAAHVILVPPPRGPAQLAAFFTDGPSKAAIARALVESAGVGGDTKTEFDARKAEATCRTDGVYPLKLRTMVEFEASALRKDPIGTTAAARFEAYAAYLTGQGQQWPGYGELVEAALAIRKALDVAKAGPGVAVIRAQYMPEPDWAALLPAEVLRATTQQQRAFRWTKAVATGMDHGVVFLDAINGKKYADIFFVTHEISHCLFGSHAFEPSAAADHDRSDLNCIMYYNSNNGGLAYGWGVRTLPREFEVTLTLRKADMAATTHDSYGSISAPGFVATNPKEYAFTGDAAALERSLARLVFEPASRLGADYRVALELRGSGVSPSLTPTRLPLEIEVRAGDGRSRPFADVRVQPPAATQPRFCGKCLLKLRGWRVRDMPPGMRYQGAHPLAARSPVVPVNPTMTFLGYAMKTGGYVSDASGADVYIPLADGATDPLDARIALGPYAFLHRHRLTWEASNGRLAALADVSTREWVRFRTPTQASPFSEFADPDQDFTQVGSNGDIGHADDDHSIGWPALVVRSPLRAGSIIGEQWYQYSFDGREWHNIEGAAFLLEKRVHFSGGKWLLTFAKTNWAPHNPKPFAFECSYIIGTAPRSQPKIVANPQAATPAAPVQAGAAVIMQSGLRCAVRTGAGTVPTTLDELRRKGYVP